MRRTSRATHWPAFDSNSVSDLDRDTVDDLDILYKYLSTNRLKRYASRRHVEAILSAVAQLEPRSRRRVLNVGCGDSYVSATLLANQPDIGQLAGLDVSEDAIRVSYELYRQNGLDHPLVRGSVLELPFDAAAFDLCLCSEVLEHVRNVDGALRELHRVTGSYAILSVPNDRVFRLANLARGAHWASLGNPPGHLQHFSRRSFFRRIRPLFEVVNVAVPVGLWIVVLARPRDLSSGVVAER